MSRTVYVEGDARAMTQLDNKLFVVFGSSKIEVYDAQTLNQLSVIKVKGLKDPHDIVSCRDDRQLYVADSGGIWRVSATDPRHSENWFTTDTAKVSRAVRSELFTAPLLDRLSCREFMYSSVYNQKPIDLVFFVAGT